MYFSSLRADVWHQIFLVEVDHLPDGVIAVVWAIPAATALWQRPREPEHPPPEYWRLPRAVSLVG